VGFAFAAQAFVAQAQTQQTQKGHVIADTLEANRLISPAFTWDFSRGERPVSAVSLIVDKEPDGYTYVRWSNGTVLYRSNDGHDDDDIQAAVDALTNGDKTLPGRQSKL